MHRIFVAVDISEAARKRASEYVDELRSGFPRLPISWVRPEKLHLTLRFIGDCGERELETIRDVVEEIAAESQPFHLSITGTGVFPSEHRARVLWLGVGGEVDAMSRVKDLFEDAYKRAGLLGKRPSLTPHLTIARVKDASRCRDLIEKHLATQFEPVEFEVSEFVIYESELRPTGSVYSVVSKASL